MSTFIRLVRHAEVEERHRGTFYGDAEVPLSAAGLRESRRLAEVLAADSPARVYSSPLSRARVLADAVASAAAAPLVVERDLRELHRGSWTHLSHAQLEAREPGALKRYALDPETGNAADGERESELCARVWGLLDRIAAEQPGQAVLLATHAHVIRVTLRRLLGWGATESLQRFVPFLGVVDIALSPDGGGEVLAVPPALERDRAVNP